MIISQRNQSKNFCKQERSMLKYLKIKEAESGRLDLNQRPLTPHASALPGWATPRSKNITERIY